MRKGWRVDFGIYAPNDFVDKKEGKQFEWNFAVAEHKLPEFLDDLLTVLSEKDRSIVARHTVGESFRSIAPSMSMSHQAVWKRYNRALRKMREYATF
jgi:DNA-directed RNA polymerase specialized sigma24 family protein